MKPIQTFIALIALLLFGAGRLADIGKGLGQGIRNFKQGLRDAESEGAGAEAKGTEAKQLEGKTGAKSSSNDG